MRAAAAGLLVTAILLAACNGEEPEFLEVSRTRQCRANMNTLCTDQAMHHLMKGAWAMTVEELDCEAGRPIPLICPESGLDYEMTADSLEYTIRCPCGLHGYITNGRQSWSEGSPHY